MVYETSCIQCDEKVLIKHDDERCKLILTATLAAADASPKNVFCIYSAGLHNLDILASGGGGDGARQELCRNSEAEKEITKLYILD
jgi:hypothetical protein